MRYDILIPFVIIAGIAVFSVSRLTKGSPMASDEKQRQQDALDRMRDIYSRSRQKIAVLRAERRKIVETFTKKVDAVRAAKVKKDIAGI